MRVEENIRYGTGEKELLDIYYPDADNYDILIWFHGGCLEAGNRKHIRFAGDLAKEGMAVVSVEYRLYPEAVFPEFITDCAKAVQYVTAHIAGKEGAGKVYVSGQSAGAYITLMLAFNPSYLEKAGVDRSGIAGYISDSGQTTTHFNVLRERGIDSRLERIDEAAPLYHLSDKSDFGNLLLIYYTEDMPCRPEQNRLLYQSIRRLCPDQRVSLVELPGVHVNGSVNRNERGTFDFADTLLAFLRG